MLHLDKEFLGCNMLRLKLELCHFGNVEKALDLSKLLTGLYACNPANARLMAE